MIHFIDTNIFMYAVGQTHPYKDPSQMLINRILQNEVAAATNTEVLQEILYRYTAIDRVKVGFDLVDTILDTFPLIWPVTKEDVGLARRLQARFHIKTRDAIHAATMKNNTVTHLYSYDADFDRLPGINRVLP